MLLTSQPTADVSLGVISRDPSEGATSVRRLTFTPDNWSVPQRVVVTGVDDNIPDGSAPYTISIGPAMTADASYYGLHAADIALTNLDDDPIYSITADDAAKAEGNSGNTPFAFTVSRSGGTTRRTTVDYVVAGSGTHAADEADFGGTLPTGTVVFDVGEVSKAITINASGDWSVEADEDFSAGASICRYRRVALLQNAASASFGDSTTIGLR